MVFCLRISGVPKTNILQSLLTFLQRSAVSIFNPFLGCSQLLQCAEFFKRAKFSKKAGDKQVLSQQKNGLKTGELSTVGEKNGRTYFLLFALPLKYFYRSLYYFLFYFRIKNTVQNDQNHKKKGTIIKCEAEKRAFKRTCPSKDGRLRQTSTTG